MIYKNLLFFHIPKAGGSSIEKFLLGKHSRMDFVIRFIFRESKFSNWLVGSMRHKIWRFFIFWICSLFLCDWKNLWGISRTKVLHHLTYLDIFRREKFYLQNKTLRDYKKFCIVRNPYDRLISAYHFLGHGLTFEKFIHWVYQELDNYYRYREDPFIVILPQWEFVIDENGKNGMDHTLRFESLKKDFRRLQKQYDLPQIKLPHINKRKRLNKNIKTYFNRELADMVYHMYKWDFKMFGYKKLSFPHLTFDPSA